MHAIRLVWDANRALTIAVVCLTVVMGTLPAAIAYMASLIVDAIVGATRGEVSAEHVLGLVMLEAFIVTASTAAQRGLLVCRTLLRPLMAQQVSTMILEKACTFELEHFEDSEVYDRLSRARRESARRPLSLVWGMTDLAQKAIALASFGSLLLQWSPWAVAVLLVAGVPGFVVEARFSGDAFLLFRRRSPDLRMQMYLETVLAREDFAKEVKFFALGRRFLERHAKEFQRYYPEYRSLTVKRHVWGLSLAMLTTFAFYGVYTWIALAAVRGGISLGQMTMYLMLFRQGQAVVSSALSAIGRMYEDALYLSTLYEVLAMPIPPTPEGLTHGPAPGDGLRLEDVSFAYPGETEQAIHGVTLHLPPGRSLALIGENGSGKTTLVKLVTRLYRPTSGRILLDGLDLNAWNESALRKRISAVFQDFNRYQIQLGENIGAGDERFFDDEARWAQAAALGRAGGIAARLPHGYRTQLGKWFEGGRDLSGGEWQRVAVSRSFMRVDADLFVLDEPTAALDARTEAEIFQTIQRRPGRCMVILISHRLAAARLADEIVVLERGRITERGTHASLLAEGGYYAHLVRARRGEQGRVGRRPPAAAVDEMPSPVEAP